MFLNIKDKRYKIQTIKHMESIYLYFRPTFRKIDQKSLLAKNNSKKKQIVCGGGNRVGKRRGTDRRSNSSDK